jgi:hypothetical protein
MDNPLEERNPCCSCEEFVDLAKREFEELDEWETGTLNGKQIHTLCTQLFKGLPENSKVSAADRASLSELVIAKHNTLDMSAVEGAAVLLFLAASGRMFAGVVPQVRIGVIERQAATESARAAGILRREDAIIRWQRVRRSLRHVIRESQRVRQSEVEAA